MQIKTCFNTLVAAAAATLTLAMPAHAAPVSGQGTWETTLQARDLDGNGSTDAFYDTILNITWLRNANVNGAMTWAEAITWAAGYGIGSYSDWRLPTLTVANPNLIASYNGSTDVGYNVPGSSSEMASLFFDTLGNNSLVDTSNSFQTSYGLTNSGDFQNMLSDDYWSGLEYAANPDSAWGFEFIWGYQSAYSKNSSQFYAMAVRPGDVRDATVPEPESLVLALTALAGLGLIRRRRTVGALAL